MKFELEPSVVARGTVLPQENTGSDETVRRCTRYGNTRRERISIDFRAIEGRESVIMIPRVRMFESPFAEPWRDARVRTMFTQPVILYERAARISFDKYAGSSHSLLHL